MPVQAYMVLAAALQAVAHALQAVQAPQSAAQAPQSAPPGPSPKTIHQQPLSSTSTQHLDTQLVLTHGSEPHAGAVAARAAHAVHITWSAVLVERALWAAEVTVNRGLHASAPTKTLEKSKVEQPPAKQQAALKGLVSGKGRAMATSAETSAAVGVEGETGVRSSKRARE